MEFFSIFDERNSREERKIERICRNFDMDCVDLDHRACWEGARGVMPCCGIEVEFEKVRGICPFLWLQQNG
jgi:hypothetical protein